MAYSKTVWVDDSTPAIDAAHLNNIENGIEGIDVRVSANESDIVANSASIAVNTADITTNANSIASLSTALSSAFIIKTGTFSGTWNPTLSSTFGVATPSDYNWVVQVHQNNWSTGSTVVNVLLDGYLDVDGNTVRFTSSVAGVAKTARYTIMGFSKNYSSLATVNG